MAKSAEHRSKFAALHQQWWRLHMSEIFSSGTKNPKQSMKHIILPRITCNNEHKYILSVSNYYSSNTQYRNCPYSNLLTNHSKQQVYKANMVSIEHKNTTVFISFSNVYNDANISLCALWQVVKSLHCWTKCWWSPITMINLTKTVNKLMIKELSVGNTVVKMELRVIFFCTCKNEIQ